MECGIPEDSLTKNTSEPPQFPPQDMCVTTHKCPDAAESIRKNSLISASVTTRRLADPVAQGDDRVDLVNLKGASAANMQVQVKNQYGPIRIDVNELEQLRNLLSQEPSDHLNLSCLRNIDRSVENKVDSYLRDEAVSNLRTLHRFYDRPHTELLHTVSILDRFIARVKVKPKYIACVATACFIINMKLHSVHQDKKLLERETVPTSNTLADIVRFGGSGSDLDRMQEIIVGKGIRLSQPLVMDFLKVFLCKDQIDLPIMYTLEAAIFSVNVYCHRPCCLALALCRIHKSLPEQMLGWFMQLCMISETELTICESFLRKSEQRFRENCWRSPASGLWPSVAMERRRSWRSPRKMPRQMSCLPLYACPDLTVTEEIHASSNDDGCPDKLDSGDASSFLLALILDRSFPGVELTYHQQCPVVRILWRSQLQNWHPKNGEHPFVFVLWNQLNGKRLVSAEETREMFQRALLTDNNVRERIDFPSNRPEEHRVFEFCPRTFSKATWETRVFKAALSLGFEPPSARSLHSLLAEVKAYQNNQKEIHDRNHSGVCDISIFKRLSTKSVNGCKKLCDRKTKHSKHFCIKQDARKRQRRKPESESFFETIFGISSGKGETRGLTRTAILSAGAKESMRTVCGLSDVTENHQLRFPLANTVGV